MMPTAIQVGGLALIVGMFALAQRLGGWEHKPLARGVGIAAGALFVAWCFLFFASWIGWTVAAAVWSICLWFIFTWVRKSVDETREPTKGPEIGRPGTLHQERITELNQELFNARAQLADVKNELQRRDAVAAEAEAQKDKEVFLLSKAPRLWVDYKPETRGSSDPGESEALIFSKEGDAAIRTIQVGPLIWTIRETRPINLHSVIGPLRAQPVECKFTAFEQIGNAQTLYQLPGLFREMMRKFGPQAQPAVEISYEDFDGNWFCRAFVLAIDPYNRIVWEPDPVRLAKPPEGSAPGLS